MAVSVELMGKDTGTNKADGSGGKLSYAEAVAERSKIEEKIGLSLAKNGKLLNVAKNIHKKSNINIDDDKEDIAKQANIFGGARASQEEAETLGRYVFETMHHIEKDKAKYSTSRTADHPYFPTGQKKPEFDKPLADCKWEELPEEAKPRICERAASVEDGKPKFSVDYNELNSNKRLSLLETYRFDSTEAKTTAGTLKQQLQTTIPTETMNLINEAFDSPEDDEKRNAAIDAIKTAMTTANDQGKAQLGALLDIVVDRHTSGINTNLVRKNEDGGVKDQWIKDTIKAGKPIISGPSGHTLRYLNFWTEKRNEQKDNEDRNLRPQEVTTWPSLEEARLVMMANLMPPKHHSYDEIMTASIGITDKTGQSGNSLAYRYKSSYKDLKEHQSPAAKTIAEKAYDEAKVSESQLHASTEANGNGVLSPLDMELNRNQRIAQLDKEIKELEAKKTALQAQKDQLSAP